MDRMTNTVRQETDTRHAGLFSDLLAEMFKRADPFGHQWVEVIGGDEVRLHSRYTHDGTVHEITQTMRLETRAEIQ